MNRLPDDCWNLLLHELSNNRRHVNAFAKTCKRAYRLSKPFLKAISEKKVEIYYARGLTEFRDENITMTIRPPDDPSDTYIKVSFTFDELRPHYAGSHYTLHWVPTKNKVLFVSTCGLYHGRIRHKYFLKPPPQYSDD